jgi:pyrroloquinoline quinone (PQQ) biosynthesis protein C
MTKQFLTARLEELKKQAETGKKILDNLTAQRQEAEQTLLRISGAIQVLEELLAADSENQQSLR